MRSSPRFIRPHSFILKNYIGEFDDEARYIDTEIKYVRVDENYGIVQSQKGVDSDDKMLIVIDLSDYLALQENSTNAIYVAPETYNNKHGTFTLRGDKDIVVYRGQEYTINSIKTHSLFSTNPEYIEVLIK
jgi:hypothetical protein